MSNQNVSGQPELKSSAEISSRIIILSYLCYIDIEQDDAPVAVDFLKTHNLWDQCSSTEKEFFQKELSQEEKTLISWRLESIWILLWVINLVEDPGLPVQEIQIDEVLARIPAFMEDPGDFIKYAKTRNVADIIEVRDMVTQLHSVVSRRADKKSKPGELHPAVLAERNHALEWVTYKLMEWDAIDTHS